MNKEQYVSFDTAKLLKEKGFDWSTSKLYGKCRVYNGEPIDLDTECELKDEGKGDEITTAYMQYDMWWVKSDSDLGIPCPSQQMACRWLREEKGIFVDIRVYSGLPVQFGYDISVLYPDKTLVDKGGTFGFSSYEEATEKGLKYVLQNLSKYL